MFPPNLTVVWELEENGAGSFLAGVGAGVNGNWGDTLGTPRQLGWWDGWLGQEGPPVAELLVQTSIREAQGGDRQGGPLPLLNPQGIWKFLRSP